MDNLATIVGKNLANLRKTKGLTQTELASLIHYSDKSISKWELGYALPSVDILMDFCSFYGVSLDYLVSEKSEEEAKEALTPKDQKGDPNRPIIMGMTVMVAIIIAMCVFFSSYFIPMGGTPSRVYWSVYLWMIPCTLFLLTMETHFFYHSGLWVTILLSGAMWSLILDFAIYFQFFKDPPESIWYILLVGIPLQVIFILAKNIKKRS